MQRIYRVIVLAIVFVPTISPLDWNRYTTNQLIESKDRAKRAGNTAITQQIDTVLASRGITSTITLAQAPEGQEWVLRNKTMGLEQRTDSPTMSPPGAGAGQWIFADPNWLYLEKSSGNIIDTNGIRVGKIGDSESTTGGIAPAVAQALQEATERETKAHQQTENLLAAERTKYASRVQELEAQIAELAKKTESTIGETSSPTTSEPSAVDVPTAPEAPEAPSSVPAAPEAPEAPEAPAAPDAPSAPDAPGFGIEETSENKKIIAPLSADELTKLQAAQQATSDQLFIATIKKINNVFVQNLDNEPYIAIIKKELTLLRNNSGFYKRGELDQLLQKELQACLNLSKDAPTLTTCFKNSCSACLFDQSASSSLSADLQIIVETMLSASDELFKACIKSCTNNFPKEINGRSYANMVIDACRDLEKNKNFHKKGNHKFGIAAIIKALQNLPYDSENPTAYLETFNSEKETYFLSLLDECKACLFDTADDAQMSDDIRWIISFIVAASRIDQDIPEFANSSSAQSMSNLFIIDLFIQSDPSTATVEASWLPALRDALTNPSFLKPNGLMVSYGTSSSFSAKNINQPVMQILSQPTSKNIKDPSLAFINSITSYLTFESEKARSTLSQHKAIINTILSKPRLQKSAPKAVATAPESIESFFQANAFAHKTLLQMIELLEKIKTKPTALQNALDLMKRDANYEPTIIEHLTKAGFSAQQLSDMKTVLINHQKHFALITYLIEYMKEYDAAMKKPKNLYYKNGKQLYRFIKTEIKDPQLIEAFERTDREADVVYSALASYLKAIPNSFTKTIPASLFRKTIEPYGILIKTLEAFNADMSSPENKNKALSRLINAITALNSGKLSTGTDYPDIITASKDNIENQQLYKGQLEAALQALVGYRFDTFIQAIDSFVAESGTIAIQENDGSIKRSALYDNIIATFKDAEGTLLINDIKRILETIDQASYKLPGFEQDTSENLNALIQLRKKLTPIIKLLGSSLATLKTDEYKQKYTELINGDEFLKTANIKNDTKQRLKQSLLQELDSLTARIQALQAKKTAQAAKP